MQKTPSRPSRGLSAVLIVASLAVAAADLRAAESALGVIPIVMPFYTPDTSGGLGFYLMFYEKTQRKGALEKPDEYALYGSYSLERQASIGAAVAVHLRDIPLTLACDAEWSFMPTSFWGVGRDAPDSAEEKYTATTAALRPSVLFRLCEFASIGPILDVRFVSLEGTARGGLLESASVVGGDGTTVAGGGFRFTLDLRDGAFYPRGGFYLDVQEVSYRKSYGGTEDFDTLDVDGRYYLGIAGDHVLAFQTLFTLGCGSVPFEAMKGLGGNVMMRGLLSDRYVDKCRWAGQAEYRFPLFWRFAGALFASAGTVDPTPSGLLRSEVRTAGGLGLRFIADAEEHIALRLDLGFDEYGRARAYFMVKEAF